MKQPWYWLNDNSREFFARGYLQEGQSAEERIKEIGDTAERYLKMGGFSDKFIEYMSKGWISLASPVWSNFGTNRGLPISCFGSYIADDMGRIMYSQAENGMMSKYGGGTSGYFGDLRPRGAEIKQNGKSSGPVHFMQLFETLLDVVSQGSVRRGSFASYLPVEHPDIMEFLDIGSEGNPIQTMTYAVTVGNEWMEEMIAGDEDKRKIWAKVIQRRGEIGYPYIMFSDNVNDGRPQVYKDRGDRILASNLCSEIMLPSNDDWSFVCCLSSLNLLHYDDWKDTDLVETMTYFLDAVMEEFIEKSKDLPFMERAHNFAKANRALGLGVLGYHSYLQANEIPFASEEARKINDEMFRVMSVKSRMASAKMAELLGEPEVLKGYGLRNTTTMAIAPTTSSAFILGQVSQGIEPVWSNCYVKDVAKMKVVIKNPLLEQKLENLGMNTREVWASIRDNDGSVQHLDIPESDKVIFRTFAELDQKEIIQQAADRQKYIDQGQSLNVMVEPDTPVKEINAMYIDAWKRGVKALYYQHSMNAAQQMVRKKLEKPKVTVAGKVCTSCEG